jgi:hypothetical protein
VLPSASSSLRRDVREERALTEALARVTSAEQRNGFWPPWVFWNHVRTVARWPSPASWRWDTRSASVTTASRACSREGAQALEPSSTSQNEQLVRGLRLLLDRHDCALLTSKGQPTRAARDLLEALVLGQVQRLLASPELVARTITAVSRENSSAGDSGLEESDVIEALGVLEPVWDELYPAEQARILRLLIERIDVAPDGISVTLHAAGIRSLVAELASERVSIDRSIWYFAVESERGRSLAWRPPIEPTRAAQRPHG